MPLDGLAIGIIALASVVVLTLIVGFAIFWHIMKADLLKKENAAEDVRNPKVKRRKNKSSRRSSAGGRGSSNGGVGGGGGSMQQPRSSVPVRLGAPTTVEDANGEDPIISFYDDGNIPLALGAIHAMEHSPPQNTNPLANKDLDPHQRYLQESPARAPQAGGGGSGLLAGIKVPTRIGRDEHEVIRRNSTGKGKVHDDRLSWESTHSVRSVEDTAQLASLAKMRVMANRQQEDSVTNPQRVLDRKFSRSSIDQQLLVQRDETELTMILSDYAMSPTTQDQLYAGSHIEGHGEAETPSSSTTWTEAGTGASTRQGSPVRRRSKSRQSNSNRDSNHRDSNRDSVGTPYGFGSASEASDESDDSNSLDGFGAEDEELQRMSRNMEHIGMNDHENDELNGELGNIEANFTQRTARPVGPNPDSLSGFM